MLEFLTGFIVGINVGVFAWSLLRMSALQGLDAGESRPVQQETSDPVRASGDEEWVWVT